MDKEYLLKQINQLRSEHVAYSGEGRCSNWDEYTRISGAIAAIDRVLTIVEELRDGNEDD